MWVPSVLPSKRETLAAARPTRRDSLLVAKLLVSSPRLILSIRRENHITTSDDTPYLQVGESKYGKPILDRIIDPKSTLETAVVCGLVSMDSTIRSNLTVGPPVEVIVYETDTLKITRQYRFDESSEYLRQISKSWDAKLKEAFSSMPPIAWSANWDEAKENI